MTPGPYENAIEEYVLLPHSIYYIDTYEIPGFFPGILSFTCEDIMVVMATSVSANEKRASQHLVIGVYMIKRILHSRLWIRILS